MEVMRVAVSLNFFLTNCWCGFEGIHNCNGSNFRYWLTRARMKISLAR